MALALKDRVKETTIVVGTGAATLLGSSIGFQPFSVVGNGNTTYYCISDQFGSNWEVGIGTYSSSGNTLARTTVLASSNAGALVVFTTGVKDVFVTYPSEKGVWYDASGNVLFTGTTTATNLAYTGTLTGSTGILNIGSGQLYKDASGNVGIGTSSPANKFQVSYTTTAPSVSSDAGAGLSLLGSSSERLNFGNYIGAPYGSWIQTSNAAGSTYPISLNPLGGSVGIGVQAPLVTLDVRSPAGTTANFWGNNANNFISISDNNGTNAAGFGSIAGGNWYLYTTGYGAFYTGGAERMRIGSSGNVGIGTSSPAAHVKLAVNGTIQIGTGTSSSAGCIFSNANFGMLFQALQASPGLADFAWFNSAGTERMRIDSSGNVGIGLTSPTGKLDVAGTIKTLGYTVATLPTGVVGARAYVTDALTPVFGATVVTGGAVTIPVFYNGTNWIVG